MGKSIFKKFIEDSKKWEKRDDFIKKQESSPKIAEILKKYGKSEGDLNDIFVKLMACGVSEKISLRVISEPRLLEKYLDLKKSGMNDIELAKVFLTPVRINKERIVVIWRIFILLFALFSGLMILVDYSRTHGNGLISGLGIPIFFFLGWISFIVWAYNKEE